MNTFKITGYDELRTLDGKAFYRQNQEGSLIKLRAIGFNKLAELAKSANEPDEIAIENWTIFEAEGMPNKEIRNGYIRWTLSSKL